MQAVSRQEQCFFARNGLHFPSIGKSEHGKAFPPIRIRFFCFALCAGDKPAQQFCIRVFYYFLVCFNFRWRFMASKVSSLMSCSILQASLAAIS